MPSLSEFSTVCCDPYSQRLLTLLLQCPTGFGLCFHFHLFLCIFYFFFDFFCDLLVIHQRVVQPPYVGIFNSFSPVIDICKTMNFTFFSSAHGTFSRIDHILGHKSSPGKFKKLEIIPSIFSDHNAVRLDLNYRRKTLFKIPTYGG